jgi:hypothetical protein
VEILLTPRQFSSSAMNIPAETDCNGKREMPAKKKPSNRKAFV